jgi:hypothetical protein
MHARLVIALILVGCGPTSSTKPSGTASDPVTTCERVADVCRLDASRLGVCVQARGGSAGALTCQSQH